VWPTLRLRENAEVDTGSLRESLRGVVHTFIA
jgi:hypothetical protein